MTKPALQLRKIQGLCIDCPNKAAMNRVRCNNCLTRTNRWKKDNKLAIQEYQRKWCKGNIDHTRKYARERMRGIRKEVLIAYGNKCIQCGEVRQGCLELDHIGNNGAEHRRELKIKGGSNAMTQWLHRNNYPSGFQILCGNCHRLKHYRNYD